MALLIRSVFQLRLLLYDPQFHMNSRHLEFKGNLLEKFTLTIRERTVENIFRF